MKFDPKDTPKAILLLAAIVAAIAFAMWRVVPLLQGDEPAIGSGLATTGTPVQSAQLQPSTSGVSTETLLGDIERWSQTPAVPAGGDPFREVLATANTGGGRSAYQPPRMPGAMDNVPFMPGASFGGQTATIDFPELRLHGVLVDPTPSESFAVISVNGRMAYAHTGDELAEGVKLTEIRESGIWITAGKEKSFVEVNRAVRPGSQESAS